MFFFLIQVNGNIPDFLAKMHFYDLAENFCHFHFFTLNIKLKVSKAKGFWGSSFQRFLDINKYDEN